MSPSFSRSSSSSAVAAARMVLRARSSSTRATHVRHMSNMHDPILNNVTMMQMIQKVLTVGDEIDPNLFEPVDAAFEIMNKISSAQRAFFERTVKEMETDPYAKWTSLCTRCDATGQYKFRSDCCRCVQPPRHSLLFAVASATVEKAWSRDAVRAARMEAHGEGDREAAVGRVQQR